jgi:tetratricopeptide (TPR) repeat protein
MKHKAKRQAKQAEAPTFQSVLTEIRQVAYKYLQEKDFTSAQLAFRKLLELDNADINARYVYAVLIDDGSHKKRAEARDLMLSILEEHPGIFDAATEQNLDLIRNTAVRCNHVGPFAKSIELFRRLARMSNQAADYFSLSEILSYGDLLEESIASLEKAIQLDPANFDTQVNRETLEVAKSRLARSNSAQATAKTKVGHYPTTQDFLGDFQQLIKNHVAVNLKSEAPFVEKKAKFFTMGSCFARNLSKSLRDSGYDSYHLEISEYINTTFANRVFVDWLRDSSVDEAIRDRIAELLPPGWSKEATLSTIKQSSVFILTLGVAAAFFDRTTGAFVLPRPTALNSRALAEKYLFRTASVKENVDNVLYLIDFVRNLVPDIKIVVTVSPVPLFASFENESVVQADCLSKSTMRLVAHEVVNNCNISNILYWPSFEIFRWVGSQSSSYYAADDGAAWHVSEDKVGGTIRAFVDMFSPAVV